MSNKLNDDFFGPFATSLRTLMEKHPVTGAVTTPNILAQELGTSVQTISYYVNGKRKPSYENIVTLTQYFNVSADYLLFGVESDNRDMNQQTGLTNDAINLLRTSYETGKSTCTTDVTGLLTNLLADRSFYQFLEDVVYHSAMIKALESMDPLEQSQKYPDINIAGYHKWALMQEIQDFIFEQMKKNGLAVEYK